MGGKFTERTALRDWAEQSVYKAYALRDWAEQSVYGVRSLAEQSR